MNSVMTYCLLDICLDLYVWDAFSSEQQSIKWVQIDETTIKSKCGWAGGTSKRVETQPQPA